LINRPPAFFSQLISASVACVLVCLVAVRLAGQGAGPSLTLLSRDARRAIPIVAAGDRDMIALDDLAAAFQLTVREEAGAITVSYRGRTIVLTPNQALASVAGRLVSLPAPASRSGTRWVVPVEFISLALAPIYDTRLDLRRPSRLVVVGDLRVPRVTVTQEVSANATRLTIDATPPAQSAISQEAGRLVVRFEADALDAALPPVPAPGLVQAIRLLDPVALAVDVGPRYSSFRASAQTSGNTARLVLDVLASATDTAAPPPASAPPPPAPAPPLPVFGQPVSAIRTIVIDPGHGGEDAGARGADGSIEKDLTLAIARRLRSALEGRLGIRVLLTREDDHTVPLDQRTAVANNNKADVFISLHANASVRPAAAGASIYVAAFDDHDEGQTRLTPERLAVFGGGLRDIELVPWDLAQIRHIDQSLELARMLEEEVRSRVAVDVHAVDRAPFRVLESANMPAVLVEMGFLTNPAQEKVMATAEFQGSFVQAIYDALVRFRGYLGETGGAP
jgi:N-acetylmuramoyl-L-alanine amidase